MNGPNRLDATRIHFQRYSEIIAQQDFDQDPLASDERLSLKNLAWICKEGFEASGSLPIDKISRWLGFVQGCLTMRGILDVDGERDFSRPLFHEAYRNEGIPIPSKRERTGDQANTPGPPSTLDDFHSRHNQED